MSIATLLSQHHQVTAVDIIPEKVDMINNRKSPIQDDYIEKYLAEKKLNLTATLDAKAAFHWFSTASTAFQRVARSAYPGGAWDGSMISAWTSSFFLL